MAALALEQEKSRQHIEQLIQFDPMTGLPNRNNLHNYLDDFGRQSRLSGGVSHRC